MMYINLGMWSILGHVTYTVHHRRIVMLSYFMQQLQTYIAYYLCQVLLLNYICFTTKEPA